MRAIPFVGRLVVQLVHVNVLDTATRLAAQTFLTGIPVLFVLAAFAPATVRDNLVDSLRSILGLGSRSLAEVTDTLHGGHEPDGEAIGGIGVVITLLSATACSRVLQRLCERSWHMPPAAARLAAWRWVAWLVVWLAVLVFQGKVRAGFGVGQGLGLPMALVTACLMWWWTQYLLLAGRLPWRPLLPGAVLTGAAMTALAGAAKIYVPNSLDRSISQFGPLGLVFTVFSWLIVLFTAATVCVATGFVIAHEPTMARLLKTPPAPDQTD
ncbi:YhjD/YihY/BrkB family envelope integrity protein [Catenulispora sp. GP43]|uniref:YhjD/YihY/BrkB family envelope integrity protein n=1 Tax=Catenulispora sp. GP43 TaxID=3156263 RepID=UPI0035124839